MPLRRENVGASQGEGGPRDELEGMLAAQLIESHNGPSPASLTLPHGRVPLIERAGFTQLQTASLR